MQNTKIKNIWLVFGFLTFFLTSCEDTNLFILTDAASDAASALTLDDEKVKALANRAAKEMDGQAQIAGSNSSYGRRLRRLVDEHEYHDGIGFNYKVYLTKDINAFAMADGTIRIYSGLMDIMNDQELLFVIGHEMGHVVLNHSRKKVALAYASSAVRKGLASQENEVGQIARSVIGGLVEQLTNAQFSQYEERQADKYGVFFMESEGVDRENAVTALYKLAELARNHTVLSSHPDPEKRGQWIANGDLVSDEDEQSLLTKIVGYLKKLLIFLYNVVVYLLSFVF